MNVFTVGGPVVWDHDYSFEEFAMEGDGIVQVLHRAECGAIIHYYLPLDEGSEEWKIQDAKKDSAYF